MSNKLGLTKEEDKNIKIICEFLFFDRLTEIATFERFEKCFQPLFNNIDISMEKVFKEICGPKKKYITFKRFAKAYESYINKKDSLSKDTYIFFDKLLNSILKNKKVIIRRQSRKCIFKNIKFNISGYFTSPNLSNIFVIRINFILFNNIFCYYLSFYIFWNIIFIFFFLFSCV